MPYLVNTMCSRHHYRRTALRVALLIVLYCTMLYVPSVQASGAITLRYNHHLFTVNPDSYADWKTGEKEYVFNGMKISPLPFGRLNEKEEWVTDESLLPAGTEIIQSVGWNRAAIISTIQEKVSKPLNLAPGSVRISGGPGTDQPITFDGIGLPGRTVNESVLAELLIVAIENDKNDITIPVNITQPNIQVDNPELVARGIKEVVTLGESEFIGSTQDRQHNIRTGLSKFNGSLIPKGSEFSFNTILGRVDGSTGYRKELVIQGDRTVPEYGGGLCQVSTTAYRGVWEYGFPITARRNHSYTVSYYYPQGTDATIYPGVQDMKFTNDSPGDLLIQTHTEGVRAYFIYYGTKDERTSQIIGPYIWGRTAAPPKRIEYVDDLPPGKQKNVGNAVAGMKTAWFRVVQPVGATEKTTESYYSTYQARPLFLLIGREKPVDVASPTDPNAVPVPSWLLGEQSDG